MKLVFYFIKTNIAFFALWCAVCTGCTLNKNDFDTRSRKIKIYSETSKVQPYFIPLSIGEITPKGWIKDWAVDAAEGITGHLDEYSASINEGWTGYDFIEVRGAGPGGTGWPLELSAHWLEGALNLSYILKDSALFSKVSKRLDKVVDGVLNGGETLIYWLPKSILGDSLGNNNYSQNYNNWAHSMMGRVLVFYYQATHDERILEALLKVYKQFPIGSQSNIEAMIETYLLSGEKAILDSILSFSERVSYKDKADKWSKGNFIIGHSGGFYNSLKDPALLYTWTGNKTDLDASLKAIEWVENKYLLPMGLTSGEEWFAGIGATRNIETCNITYATWAFLWMLRITGDKSYSDRIEKIFFNAAAAPVSRDFKIMCYYQSANRYNDSLPGEDLQNPGKDAYKYTKIGHEVQCCVANINRNIPNYISNMWMATMDNGLAATLYGPCDVQTQIAGNVSVKIECQTSYPFEETVNMTIIPEKNIEFPIYLRVPIWCQNPSIKVNEDKIDITKEGNEFIKISRLWKKEDKIILQFPMEAKVVKGRETPYPQVKYFNNNHKLAKDTTVNSPYECIYYGPLLFSLAIPDKNPNTEMPGTKFNYALDLNSDSISSQVVVIKRPMPDKWSWSMDAPIQLRVKVKEFDWNPTENQPIPKKLVKGGNSALIYLIPYGCTKFRVTMFPVTEGSWD